MKQNPLGKYRKPADALTHRKGLAYDRQCFYESLDHEMNRAIYWGIIIGLLVIAGIVVVALLLGNGK